MLVVKKMMLIAIVMFVNGGEDVGDSESDAGGQ